MNVKHELERVDVKRDVRVSDLPVGDIKTDWVREQHEERESLVAAAVGEVVLSSGLLVEVRQGERARVIVPPMRRNALIRMAHEAQQHRSWKKILADLAGSYTWKGMSGQVKRVVQSCHSCAIVKSRRNLAHGQFASVQVGGPRSTFAIDFYEVAESADGHKYVLTVIDLFTNEVTFIATKTRTAEEVVAKLLERIVFVMGVPTCMMSDEAPEFVGKLLEGLCTTLGIHRITTKAYNARGNAKCERIHEFLGQCLVRILPEDRLRWPERLSEFAFAHNTAFHANLGCTPFELGHGTVARTVTSVPDPPDAATGYFGRVKRAAEMYADIAKKNMLVAQEEQNKRLNGTSYVKEYKIGEAVTIYFPRRGLGAKTYGQMERPDCPATESYSVQDA